MHANAAARLHVHCSRLVEYNVRCCWSWCAARSLRRERAKASRTRHVHVRSQVPS